jgi:hypothetical protein
MLLAAALTPLPIVEAALLRALFGGSGVFLGFGGLLAINTAPIFTTLNYSRYKNFCGIEA